MRTPPVAARRPHTVSAHGLEREDPWYWLRDRDDPEVITYLQAENAYADGALAPLAGLRDTLFEEMKARIKETDMSVPRPARALVVLHPDRGGEGLRHPLPAAGRRPRRAPTRR